MGLKDATYYLGWFNLFTAFALYNSTVGTVCFAITYFNRINVLIVFLSLMLYSFTIYGLCWIFVAFLPNTRGVTMISMLFQILTMFVGIQIQQQFASSALLNGLSFIPNIAMGQILKQLVFWNYNSANGLSFGQGSASFDNYSLTQGMLWLTFDAVVYTFLGLYLD